MAELRAEIWDKTNGRCSYCSLQTNPFRDFHIDHVVPFSQGGSLNVDNLVPSCATCNISKHDCAVPGSQLSEYNFPQSKWEFDWIVSKLVERVLP